MSFRRLSLISASALAVVVATAPVSALAQVAPGANATLQSWTNQVPDPGIYEVDQIATYSDGSVFNCPSTWIDIGAAPRFFPPAATGPLINNSDGTGRWSRNVPPSTNPSGTCTLQSAGSGGGTGTVDGSPTPSGGQYVVRTGDTMTGPLGMTGNKIVDLGDGEVSATSRDAVNGSQLYATNQAVAAVQETATNAQTLAQGALQRSGGTLTGNIDAGGNTVTGLRDGLVAPGSTEAVNGSQLDVVRQSASDANILAGSALDQANVSTATAQGAVTTAQGAAATAAGAATTAGAALVQSGQALDRSTDALNTANGAAAQAGNALATSSQALQQAGQASSVAGTALSTASDAANTANSALAQSATAQQSSQNANNGVAGVTRALGGGAAYDPATGTVTPPSYQVAGGFYDNVGAALTALDDAITTASGATPVNTVQYDGDDRSTVTLGGRGELPTPAVRVINLANGAVSATSSDAVNGSQLNATNERVSAVDARVDALDGRVDGIDGRVTSLEQGVAGLQNGTAGIVRQDPASGNILVGTDRGGEVVEFAGTEGDRTLTGVAAGRLAEGSNEAVNGGQLNATNTRVATLEQRSSGADAALSQVASSLGGGATYDPATQTMTGPSYALSTGTYDNVGAAVSSVDRDVQDLRSVAVTYNDATRGAVTLNAGGAPVTVDNVRDARLEAGSREAVTGSQLYATNVNVEANRQAITAVDNRVTAVDARLTETDTRLTGAVTAVDNRLTETDARLTGAVQAVDNRVTAVDNRLTETDTRLTGAVAAVDNRLTETDARLTGAVAAVDNRLTETDARLTTEIADLDDRLTDVDDRVTVTRTELAALTTGIDNGTVGLVRQVGGSPGEGAIEVGAYTGGDVVSFTGTAGDRRLTGVASGSIAAGSTDAINGGQFFDLQQQMVAGINGLDGRVTGLEESVANLQFDLSRVSRDLNGGLASVTALTSMPMSVNPGRVVLGSGFGYRDGQVAGSLGLSYRTPSDRVTINVRAGYGGRKVTAGAGVGVEF